MMNFVQSSPITASANPGFLKQIKAAGQASQQQPLEQRNDEPEPDQLTLKSDSRAQTSLASIPFLEPESPLPLNVLNADFPDPEIINATPTLRPPKLANASQSISFAGALGTTASAAISIMAIGKATQQIYPGQADKRMHALAGGGIAAVGSGITLAISQNRWASALTGLGLAVIAGAGKEIYDKASGRGTPETQDFIATALGGLAVSMSFTIPLN